MEPTNINAPETHKNEIESFADDVKKFWDKFGLGILLIVLAVLIVLLAKRYLTGREKRELETAYSALAVAKSPFDMVDTANRYEHLPAFTGHAYLQAADATLRDALGLQGLSLGAENKISDADKAKALDRAAELYGRVVKLNASPLQVINARLGLASVLETQGKFDEAKAQYEAAIKEAGETWDILAARAKSRLETLDKIKTPVVFPAPKPKLDEKKEEKAEEKKEEAKPEEKKEEKPAEAPEKK